MAVVGVVSPGTMGSAVAYALARGGARVITTVAGRSERTVRLAERAGVECLRDLAAVVEAAEVVLSIVPPEAAQDVAGDVLRACRDQDVQPLLVDLNAIAPATALRVETAAAAAGHTRWSTARSRDRPPGGPARRASTSPANVLRRWPSCPSTESIGSSSESASALRPR